MDLMSSSDISNKEAQRPYLKLSSPNSDKSLDKKLTSVNKEEKIKTEMSTSIYGKNMNLNYNIQPNEFDEVNINTYFPEGSKNKKLLQNLILNMNDDLPLNDHSTKMISEQLKSLNVDFNSEIAMLNYVQSRIKDMIAEINQRLGQLKDQHELEVNVCENIPPLTAELTNQCGDNDHKSTQADEVNNENSKLLQDIEHEITASINEENSIMIDNSISLSKVVLCDEGEIHNCNEMNVSDVSLPSEKNSPQKADCGETKNNNVSHELPQTNNAECDLSMSESSLPQNDISVAGQDDDEEIVNGYTSRALEIINEMRTLSPKKQRKLVKIHAQTLNDLELDKICKFMSTEWKKDEPGLGFWRRLSLRILTLQRTATGRKTSYEDMYKKSSNLSCWRRRKNVGSSSESADPMDPTDAGGLESAAVQADPEELMQNSQGENLTGVTLTV